MSELHGFRRGDEIIHITHLKGYKKPILMMGNRGCAWKVASFDSADSARMFQEMLARWLEVKE